MKYTLKQLNIHYILADVSPLIPSEDEATVDEINATLEENKNQEAADQKCTR